MTGTRDAYGLDLCGFAASAAGFLLAPQRMADPWTGRGNLGGIPAGGEWLG